MGWRPTVLFVLLFTAAIWAVYSPGLNRVFAGDQITYFADMEGTRSIWRHWDYTLSRRYSKGDEILFRPLSNIWLGIQHRWFYYNHRDWNLTNLVLHFLVVVSLYAWLRLTQPRAALLAGLVALWFAVLRAPYELVSWNHLGGYLWACLSLIWALIATEKIVRIDGPTPWRWWGWYVAAATATVLFYEGAMLLILINGAYLLFSLWRKHRVIRAQRNLLIFLPCVLFTAFYTGHVMRAISLPAAADVSAQYRAFGWQHLSGLPLVVLKTVVAWTRRLVLPSVLRCRPVCFRRLYEIVSPLHDPVLNVVLLALLIGAVVVLWTAISRAELRRRLALLVSLVAMLGAYAALISLGREYVGKSYYLYPYCLIALMLGYSLFDFERLSRWRQSCAIGILVAVTGVNAYLSYTVSADVALVNAEADGYFRKIAAFVDERKSEPDFSFAIANPPAVLDQNLALAPGLPSDSPDDVVRFTLPQAIFYRYYQPDHPKYRITLQP